MSVATRWHSEIIALTVRNDPEHRRLYLYEEILDEGIV